MSNLKWFNFVGNKYIPILKLRLFLVFVILYIIAVFGWWLYSFITYTEKEYQLENSNLKLNALLIQDKISNYIIVQEKFPEEKPYAIFKRHEASINSLHQNLNKTFKIKTHMVFEDSMKVHDFLKIKIDAAEFKAIHKTFIKKQRAFYSEVIFFTILVISGVVWVFGKLESLLNLNKMQNNFLLSVTHEFKTPLTAIKLSSQTLQQRKTDDETKQVLIQQMVNNSDRLNELLDNVMLATRIDGKSYRYNMNKINITDVIQKTAELILSPPYFKGNFIFEEEEYFMDGDEISMRLVFSNLFQNAIKYAGVDSDVTVKYTHTSGQFIITISDTGKGLDQKEYKAIFNKFYRVGDENTRESKGTGLGLFLVKQILKSHHARIEALRNQPQGTTFKITFK
ncbi:MAG: HAMP domain-containing sensor histidine kinase [Bacteroidia bacterium]